MGHLNGNEAETAQASAVSGSPATPARSRPSGATRRKGANNGPKADELLRRLRDRATPRQRKLIDAFSAMYTAALHDGIRAWGDAGGDSPEKLLSSLSKAARAIAIRREATRRGLSIREYAEQADFHRSQATVTHAARDAEKQRSVRKVQRLLADTLKVSPRSRDDLQTAVLDALGQEASQLFDEALDGLIGGDLISIDARRLFRLKGTDGNALAFATPDVEVTISVRVRGNEVVGLRDNEGHVDWSKVWPREDLQEERYERLGTAVRALLSHSLQSENERPDDRSTQPTPTQRGRSRWRQFRIPTQMQEDFDDVVDAVLNRVCELLEAARPDGDDGQVVQLWLGSVHEAFDR